MSTNLQTVQFLVPEAVLVLTGCLVALLGASKALSQLARPLAIVGTLICLVLLVRQGSQPVSLLAGGPLVADGLAQLGRGVAAIWALLFVLMSAGDRHASPAEYLGAGMLGFVGLMVTSSAADVVLLFLGLELVSIGSYIMLGLAGGRRGGLEGAIKYFILSILSSAIMLYGFSFLYGLAGTTELAGLSAWRVGATETPLLATLGFVFVLGGLAFKMAAVPFHFYAADVYEATSYSNAAVLAVLPKAVGLIAMLKLFLAAGWWSDQFTWQLLLAIAMFTMTLGNVCALWQQNLRRLMAYSSVAHAGYLLIGITVTMSGLLRGQDGLDGAWASLFYVVGYGLASLGVMAGLVFLRSATANLERVDELGGLATKFPGVSAAIAICMFSLTGIPPLAGFLGKLYLLKGAVFQSLSLPAEDPARLWLLVLSVVTVANAAVAATYYLRVVAALYFGAPVEKDRNITAGNPSSAWGAILAGGLVVLLGLVPAPLTRWSRQAATDLTSRLPVSTVEAVAVSNNERGGAADKLRESANLDDAVQLSQRD